MLSLQLLTLIGLICFAETAAISCIKRYHKTKNPQFFVCAVGLYSIVCFLLYRTFDFNDSMGLTNVLWSGFSVLLVLLVGIALFHESFKLHDVIGAGMITAGILVIKYFQ